MNDNELLNIFWEEASEHLEGLNTMLLQVEMIAQGDSAVYQTTVKEMNRVAHSLKGAARAVGIGTIETIAHYMEEVFGAAMHNTLDLTPAVVDTLYDGLDLIQGVGDGNEPDEAVLAAVLAQLEHTVAAVGDAISGNTTSEQNGSPPSPAPTGGDDDLMAIFWDEAVEHLETLNTLMLQVEMTEHDEAAVKELNRVAHSLKGAARAVGISIIETIAHYMEEVFGAAMQVGLTITPDVADVLYDGLDVIQGVRDGVEPDQDTLATILSRLEQIVATASEDDDTREVPAVASPPTVEMSRPAQEMNTMAVRTAEESIRVTVGKLDRLMAEVTELFVAQMHGEELQRRINDMRRTHGKWQREWRNVRTAYIRLVRRLQDSEQEMSSELPIIFRFLEFNQRQLVEANRMLAQISQTVAQDNMRLTTLAEQLQDDIGGMRLVPFDSIVGGFHRMMRDLSRDLEKQVILDVVGGQVEIDKAVLDALKDPLMHVLRNAVDHGVELPQVRRDAGKSPTGHVIITVEQRGSEIVIHVEDDGSGIDADSVRRSIVKNGLLSESEVAALSDEEARTYIFYSGLSTSETVTALSGRGMGMDIVRDRVEGLRGRVSVQSTVGSGSRITVSVPVSLTRIRCILMQVGDQQFAVPSAMVVRMDKYLREDVFTAEGRDVLLINERPMPLASLATILGVPSRGSGDEERINVIALQATDRAVAFEVDALFSEQELVLKPLGPELARARYVSGAALLGTGDVVIVLDANDLVRRASGAVLPRRRAMQVAAPVVSEQRRLRVLVVDDSITTRTLEKNILETAGFEVSVAMDGLEAWSMLPQDDFDVIISDVEMPKMNGLELCKQIKTSPQYQHIPLILLTSLGKPEQREAGLRAGANAYLVKSRFDQGELLETIQAVL